MASITISELNQVGINLFEGEESFLNDLTNELDIRGGIVTVNISAIDIPASEDIFYPSISFVY